MRVTAMSVDLAIVGSGFSGTMVALGAARSAPLRIALIDRSRDFGPEVAYAAGTAGLANIPAALTGAFTDAPDGFLRWWERTAPAAADARAFFPRQRYGDYVRELLRTAQRAGAAIVCIATEIVDCRRIASGWRLSDAGGACTIDARAVVLATGTPSPAAASRVLPGVVTDPWTLLRSAWLPTGNVLAIGSGRTALDAVLAWRSRARNGTLTALSRHGRWPLPHAFGATPDARAVPAVPPETLAGLVRFARRDIAARGGDWRAWYDAFRSVAIPVWQRLTLDDRRRFLRHVRSFYDRHRHRAPQDSLAQLAALEGDGRLRTVAGRVQSMRAIDGEVEVTYARRDGTHEAVRVAEAIDCTGPFPLARASLPLSVNLRVRGEIAWDATGLGIAARPDGVVLRADGRPQADLFAIGWPMRGVVWETRAVRELPLQAQTLATLVARAAGGRARDAETAS